MKDGSQDVKVRDSIQESDELYRKDEAKEMVKQNISEVSYEYRLKKTPKQIRNRKKIKVQKKSRWINRGK